MTYQQCRTDSSSSVKQEKSNPQMQKEPPKLKTSWLIEVVTAHWDSFLSEVPSSTQNSSQGIADIISKRYVRFS